MASTGFRNATDLIWSTGGFLGAICGLFRRRQVATLTTSDSQWLVDVVELPRSGTWTAKDDRRLRRRSVGRFLAVSLHSRRRCSPVGCRDITESSGSSPASPTASALNLFLHCTLASGAVYCNRSCLWVCLWRAGGWTVSEPYYSHRAQCLRLSERFFHSSCCCCCC